MTARRPTACGVGRSAVRVTEIADRVLVRNRAPANWPRESVEDGNHQLDGDQTLDILLGFAMVHVSMQGLEMNELERSNTTLGNCAL